MPHVLALTLHARALLLLVLIALLLAGAGAAVFVWNQALRAKNAREMVDGSDLGAATAPGSDWYAELHRDDD
jgi:hypothetical protein